MHSESLFSDPTSVWRTLEMFWSKEKVRSWYDAVFSRGTEVVYNMMCFAPSVHTYHGKALFALQPGELSEDRRCQMVKFFWLAPHQHSGRFDLLRSPEIPHPPDRGCRDLRLFNLDTERKLYSGQEIALTTSDPFRLPLPDHRILEMQWILQQVATLKGGADVFEDDSDDDGGWQAVVLSPDVEEWILDCVHNPELTTR
jgi:hypothetical protein